MARYTKKYQSKLKNLLLFTSEKNSMPVKKELVKMKKKIKIDNDILWT